MQVVQSVMVQATQERLSVSTNFEFPQAVQIVSLKLNEQVVQSVMILAQVSHEANPTTGNLELAHCVH